jgi:hypothetical protein
LKTAKWCLSAGVIVLSARVCAASMFVSVEGDVRGSHSDRHDLDAEVNSIGGSVRKVFADRRGDRVILYSRAEWADNLSEGMLHQAYAEWKGPLGRWNLAAGRVPLPWGLLTAWSPDRMPYGSPYDWTRTLDSDNGVLWRGVVDAWDYGLALTQGYGMGDIESFPGPGNLTGRVGLTPGIEGTVSLGLSFATGTAYASEHGHGTDHLTEEERTALAIDGTLYLGRGTYRFECGARRTESEWLGTAFGAMDYALFPKVTLQVAGQVYDHETSHTYGRLYGGVSVPTAWFTVRGGYEYETTDSDHHMVVVQLYRLFSFVR